MFIRHLPLFVRLLPLALALIALLGFAPPSKAAFPGDNGRFAYSGYSLEGDAWLICTRGLTGGEQCYEFDGGLGYGPRWSPNGSELVIGASGIFTANPDGSAPNHILISEQFDDADPVWSPDGSRIAFESLRDGNYEVYVMNADGSGQTRLTNDPAIDAVNSWSPDGTRIAFTSERDGNREIYVMSADGSNQTRLTNNPASDARADWSPNGTSLTFDSDRDGNFEIYRMQANGTGVTRLTTSTVNELDPVWAPDGSRIAFIDGRATVSAVSPDGTGRVTLFVTRLASEPGDLDSLDWQPLARGYVRPKGATPMRLSLVPASRPCTSPNRTHGGPLAFPSCSPPTPASSNLTIGVGDGTPPPAKSIGSVEIKALVGSPGPPDDADVALGVRITNVMNRSDSSDYTGELRLELPLRITDAFNTPSPSGYGPGTVADTSFYATVPCAGTADPTLGSTCTLASTADALLPGTVRQGARAIWGLGQVRLHDGGADGDADTPGDNQVFAVQGLFEP